MCLCYVIQSEKKKEEYHTRGSNCGSSSSSKNNFIPRTHCSNADAKSEEEEEDVYPEAPRPSVHQSGNRSSKSRRLREMSASSFPPSFSTKNLRFSALFSSLWL